MRHAVDRQPEDPAPLLRQAIALLREAELPAAAAEFEQACFATTMTHAEWSAAVADAVTRLRSACARALPREIELLLRRATRALEAAEEA